MARIVLDDETKLDRDAEIYTKRTKESEKEIRKNLDSKQKLQYFKDYYLPKILVGLLMAALLVWLGRDFFADRKDVVLYITIVDDVIAPDKVEELKHEFEELLDVDTQKQEIVINADFSSNSMDSMSQLTTYMFAGEVDVVIAPPKEFETLGRTGHFMTYDQSDVTSFYGHYEEEERLYVTIEDTDSVTDGREKEVDEISLENGEGKTNCGLSLKNSRRLKAAGSVLEEPCVGIVNNSPNKKNARTSIQYFLP